MAPNVTMKSKRQLTSDETGFLPKAGKQIRKALFRLEMETVVPWSGLDGLIEPRYSKKGNGRSPMKGCFRGEETLDLGGRGYFQKNRTNEHFEREDGVSILTPTKNLAGGDDLPRNGGLFRESV